MTPTDRDRQTVKLILSEGPENGLDGIDEYCLAGIQAERARIIELCIANEEVSKRSGETWLALGWVILRASITGE